LRDIGGVGVEKGGVRLQNTTVGESKKGRVLVRATRLLAQRQSFILGEGMPGGCGTTLDVEVGQGRENAAAR